MIERLLSKLINRLHPEREYVVKKILGRYFVIPNDIVGCNDYLLEGLYTYKEVVRLNDLTGYNASFGYCAELGPVAFIGIVDNDDVGVDGYFKHHVQEYGALHDRSEYRFTAYTLEAARTIGNYTVYGNHSYGLAEISKIAPIAKLRYTYDTRYKEKLDNQNRICEMDCKLRGTYSFDEARILATGTNFDKEFFIGDENPIIFATVGENYNIGIIGIWDDNVEQIVGFKDVWEYGREEPKIQEIRFISNEEAREISEGFTLYIYDYSYLCVHEKYNIEKYDRTLDKRFCFHLEDGSDYRLVEHIELMK